MRRLAFLGDEACVNQPAKVMGKRGCRDPVLLLKSGDTQARPACSDEGAIKVEAGGSETAEAEILEERIALNVRCRHPRDILK